MDEPDKWEPGTAVMPRLEGESRSFRCSCGANVFTRGNEENVYICNGCFIPYRGTT